MINRAALVIGALLLLGTGYILGSMPAASTQAGSAAQQGNCQTFRETGREVCGRFLKYWQEHGGLAQQGFPISQEFTEKSDLNGQSYTVQYFERAVFEYHPENQPPYDVLLSQLGTFRYKSKYGAGGGGQGQPTATPQATPTPLRPIFVDIGDDARRNGMVFAVKRVDALAKRLDVIYKIRNETGATISLTLSAADQHLTDNTGHEYVKANPGDIASVTLQNNQEYEGGTSFNADLVGKGIKGLTYSIDNLPRIGSVRVRVPIQETP